MSLGFSYSIKDMVNSPIDRTLITLVATFLCVGVAACSSGGPIGEADADENDAGTDDAGDNGDSGVSRDAGDNGDSGVSRDAGESGDSGDSGGSDGGVEAGPDTGVPDGGSSFVHPGLLDSADELDALHQHIQAAQQPWLSAYQAIPDALDHIPHPVAVYVDGVGHGEDDLQEINNTNLRLDGEAAYSAALSWIATGNTAYAERTMAILDAWSGTLVAIDVSAPDDTPLSTAYNWPRHIYAAEILRATYDGWPLAAQTSFQQMLRDLVWPAVQRAEDKSNFNNWRSLAVLCRLAISVFCDDRTMYDYALDKLRDQIEKYIYPSGQCIETPRDLQHSQMGMAPLVAAAEIAWHQGDDIYSHLDNRLLTGVEWHIPFVLGEHAGWPTEFDSTYYSAPSEPVSPFRFWFFYELVYHHYNSRLGLATPNTERMLTVPIEMPGTSTAISYRPERADRTGGWGTATHRDI